MRGKVRFYEQDHKRYFKATNYLSTHKVISGHVLERTF